MLIAFALTGLIVLGIFVNSELSLNQAIRSLNARTTISKHYKFFRF